MRNLVFLNIFFVIAFSSCDPVKKSTLSAEQKGSYKEPVWGSPFLRGYEKALFRTSLDVAGKHLTGISIIKKTSDSSFHFTFANEIGLTYLDMEIYRDRYKADYIFDPLNKKSFLKILRGDFSILFFSRSPGKPLRRYLDAGSGEAVYMYLGLKLYTWLDTKQNIVSRLAGWTNYFDAAIIDFSDFREGFPGEIRIVNPRINLTLTFNLLGN